MVLVLVVAVEVKVEEDEPLILGPVSLAVGDEIEDISLDDAEESEPPGST